MQKTILWKLSLVISLFVILIVISACAADTATNLTASATTPSSTPPAQKTAIPTQNPPNFAATFAQGGTIDRSTDRKGDNLTIIYAPTDRPVAKLSQTTLPVPPRAKGVVYVDNDSDLVQTVISDTPDGFAPFSIQPNTYITLTFYRAGTFKAHLKNYPISADTTLTIIITYPSA